MADGMIRYAIYAMLCCRHPVIGNAMGCAMVGYGQSPIAGQKQHTTAQSKLADRSVLQDAVGYPLAGHSAVRADSVATSYERSNLPVQKREMHKATFLLTTTTAQLCILEHRIRITAQHSIARSFACCIYTLFVFLLLRPQ